MPIDYKRYPKNWKTEIVPFILKRANNCCEFCGLKNKEVVKAIKIYIKIGGRYKLKTFWFRDESDFIRAKNATTGNVKNVKVVLTVAHLDHDEENHNVSMDRLAALCQFCHLNYDAAEKVRRMGMGRKSYGKELRDDKDKV